MTEIQIESNIPLTRKKDLKKRKVRMLKYNWPLKEMEVTQSIFIPMDRFPERVRSGEDTPTHYTNNVVRAHKKRYKMKNREFKARKVVDEFGTIIGARIWRVS